MRDCNIFLTCFILASLVIYVTSGTCGGLMTSDEGFFETPNFPNNYPLYQRCIWEIQPTPPHFRTTLNFTHFDLEPVVHNICLFDWVEISSRSSQDSEWRSKGKYCGSHLPPVVVFEDGALRIEFASDVTESYSGFRALYFTDSGNFDKAVNSTEHPTDWYRAEIDWNSTETQPITSLSQNPLTHPLSEPVVSTVKPIAGQFDETGSSRSNSNAESATLPCSNSEPTRGISPVSNTAPDPKYLPASPRNYLDISINFPFGQRWPAPDESLPIVPKPTQNQGMGYVPDYLKSKPSSSQFEQGIDKFLVDTQNRNVRKSDEELPSGHADASYSKNNDAPRPLMALFFFSNSYPINIRMNGQTE